MFPCFPGCRSRRWPKSSSTAQSSPTRRHTIVINQDDETYTLYIILSGSVKVFVSGEDGREVVLNHQQTGDYFGDLAMIDKQPRVASVMTMEPSKFMVISREDFLSCLSKNPEIANQPYQADDQSYQDAGEECQ